MLLKAKGVAAVAVLCGAAITLAGPAYAGPDVSGNYTVTPIVDQPDRMAPYTWIVTSCGPDCATVASSRGSTADFQFADGQWTTTTSRGGFPCTGSDRTVVHTLEVTVDAGFTMATSINTPRDPSCGSPNTSTASLALTPR
jgi:hypothetical protein